MDCEGAYTEIIFNWLNQIKEGHNEVTVYGNDVYNVSTETGISITNLIKTIEEILDIKLNIRMFPENRTDIENKRIGSVKKLKELGWSNKVDLKKGLLKTWDWINDIKNK